MKEQAMQGVGENLIEALRREATHGDADRYALRRLAALLDELEELPEARALICRTYHRSREVVERRPRRHRKPEPLSRKREVKVMSDYAEAMARVKRERQTEEQIRSMDACHLVDWIHGLEDALEDLHEDKRDLDGALERLVSLHVREQEGLSSGMPSSDEWLSAVDDAAESLNRSRGES